MTPAVENPPAEEEANAEGKKELFCLNNRIVTNFNPYTFN